MPIETNLNVSPYFDDFSPDKNYYKVLFRPGVALQARELTQLQSILQDQIEKFGDNVFKSGTIISGVNFQYNYKYDYVKILDLEVSGSPVALSSYNGLYVKNSANLVAQIVNYRTGYQARDPDTNYLFLKYVNSGNTGAISAFSSDDVLTIYSDAYKLYGFTVVNGGTSFSNSDTVQISSALIVESSNVAAGAAAYQTVGSNTANVYITESNTTFGTVTIGTNTYSSSDGYTLLKIRPIAADLSDTSKTATNWTIKTGYTLVQGSNTASVVAKVGSGAVGTITTDGSGIIEQVSIVSSGTDYDIVPHVSIRSASGVQASVNIQAKNYKAQVTVAGSTYTGGGTTPVGNGYAFSVTEGIIYQKGYFVRVDPQTIIVNAYSGNVHNVSVGFTTTESIVNSNSDSTLLDLATGTPNYAAPGANRLKLTPTLAVINTSSAAANSLFFPLVEFKEGVPAKEYDFTKFNIIAKEFDRRTSETSGNFVIDPFVISTKDKSSTNATHVDLVVDPGLAYIDGTRVRTTQNSLLDLRRGTDTKSITDQTISLNYGNYIEINEVAGYFDFKTGDTISLYDTARQYISTFQTSISATGSAIGTARIRSLVYNSGTPGTSTAVYRAYLFDINMNVGKSFKDTRSIYYSGSPAGIADIVLSVNPITSKSEAILKDTGFSSLVFPTGLKAIKSTSSSDFLYRTADTGANVSTLGVMSVSVSSPDSISYGTTSALNSVQRRDIIIIPKATGNSTTQYTVSVNASSKIVNAFSTTARINAGDYLMIEDGTTSNTYQVDKVINSTAVSLVTNFVGTTNASAYTNKRYPVNIPINLQPDSVTGNVSGTGGITLNIDIGDSITASIDCVTAFNVKRTNATPVTKNIKRNLYVKIAIANNTGYTDGPWSLGIPDGFRLNNVYLGNSSGVTTTDTNVTRYFYLDNGHRDNINDLSRLVKMYNADFSLSSTDWLLVDFDAFEAGTEGLKTIASYTLSNTGSPTSLGNNYVNVLELPEFYSTNGTYIDVRDSIDFRPRAANTAVLTSTPASANINPVSTVTLGGSDKLFPVPDSEFQYDVEHYLGRKDIAIVDVNSEVRIIEGTPSSSNIVPPVVPASAIALGVVDVPPYPTIPRAPSSNTVQFIAKSTGTDKLINNRSKTYLVNELQIRQSALALQPRRYTMQDIGKLERRLEAVEYYTSLNLLESQTKDLIIPSNVDPSINRFKNGFFVDQFNDYRQAEISSPEFFCHIDQENGKLNPPDATYNILGRFDYTDSDIVLSNTAFTTTSLTEPGLADNNETTILLPRVAEEAIFTQGKFTGLVGSDGTNTKFIGDVIIDPPSFQVMFRADVRITDELNEPAPPTGGGRGGCRVICTHMTEIGEMSPEDLAADLVFTKRLSPSVILGYHAWAFGIAEHMKQNPESGVTSATKWIARHRTNEIKYQLGIADKPDWFGKYIRLTGEAFCWGLGTLINNLGIKSVKQKVELNTIEAMAAMGESSMRDIAMVYKKVGL